MALHTLRIVDSIAATPTARLDVNDEVAGWLCTSFDAPPPRLRRSVSANAMRDGINVSSANYEARTIRARFRVTRSAVDLAAAEVQKMARELDRAGNFLMLQQSGSTKPVFFVTYRSDFTDLAGVPGDPTAFEFGVEILAEPFALGLRETLGPYTVNNDPAAGSNGLYFDVTGVIGDVETPCVLVDTSPNSTDGVVAIRQHGTPSDLVFFKQAESCTLGTDTSNPGGGPDAAMSGPGTNNYARTSFASVTNPISRVSFQFVAAGSTDAVRAASRGAYRILAVVRRSDSTSVINLSGELDASSTLIVLGDSVATALTTSRQVVDLGVFEVDGPLPGAPGLYGSANTMGAIDVKVLAGRASGAGTLDWDYIVMLPADESVLIWETSDTNLSVDHARVFDGGSEAFYYALDSATLFTGGGKVSGYNERASLSGGFPALVPSQTNRFYMLHGLASNSVSDSQSISVHYWPRYLYARPSAT